MKAFSPTGALILGAFERLTARSEIVHDSWSRGAGGTLEFEYQGSTELFWDGMETVTRNGARVFLDERGDEWSENEIVVAEEPPQIPQTESGDGVYHFTFAHPVTHEHYRIGPVPSLSSARTMLTGKVGGVHGAEFEVTRAEARFGQTAKAAP